MIAFFLIMALFSAHGTVSAAGPSLGGVVKKSKKVNKKKTLKKKKKRISTKKVISPKKKTPVSRKKSKKSFKKSHKSKKVSSHDQEKQRLLKALENLQVPAPAVQHHAHAMTVEKKKEGRQESSQAVLGQRQVGQSKGDQEERAKRRNSLKKEVLELFELTYDSRKKIQEEQHNLEKDLAGKNEEEQERILADVRNDVQEIKRKKRVRRMEKRKNNPGIDLQLLAEVRDNQATRVERSLDNGADVNCRTRDGKNETPLMIAIMNGNRDIVDLLLDRGALYNLKESHVVQQTLNNFYQKVSKGKQDKSFDEQFHAKARGQKKLVAAIKEMEEWLVSVQASYNHTAFEQIVKENNPQRLTMLADLARMQTAQFAFLKQ